MTKEPANSAIVPRTTELPPPRPGVRHVPVAGVGIIIADDRLRRRIDRFFHWPMIILALAVLPVIAIDLFYLPSHPELKGGWIWWASMIATWVIWLAFLIEFIIKISIAECRVEYAKSNWLDIIIIVLPALRPLRVAAVARTSRVFTLRGVGMKLARSLFTLVIGLDASDRLLRRIGVRTRVDRKKPSEMTRKELMAEVKQLRQLTDAWEDWHAAHIDHHDDDLQALPSPPHEEDAKTALESTSPKVDTAEMIDHSASAER